MTDTNQSERKRDAVGADGVEQVRDITLGNAEYADYSASDTTPVADATVEELQEMTTADDAPTRRRAVLALAGRDVGATVLDHLASIANEDPDAEVRQFAIEAIGELDGDPNVAKEVLEVDDDQWVRAEAAVALDRLDRAGHEAVFEALLDDDAAAVRRNALISLTRIRGKDARDEALQALEDPDDRVREWAAKLLGAHDDDEAVNEALRAVVDSPAEVDVVKTTAARSLGARGEDIESLIDTNTGTETADGHMLNQVPDPN